MMREKFQGDRSCHLGEQTEGKKTPALWPYLIGGGPSGKYGEDENGGGLGGVRGGEKKREWRGVDRGRSGEQRGICGDPVGKRCTGKGGSRDGLTSKESLWRGKEKKK